MAHCQIGIFKVLRNTLMFSTCCININLVLDVSSQSSYPQHPILKYFSTQCSRQPSNHCSLISAVCCTAAISSQPPPALLSSSSAALHRSSSLLLLAASFTLQLSVLLPLSDPVSGLPSLSTTLPALSSPILWLSCRHRSSHSHASSLSAFSFFRTTCC
jgi:hypothetical protein